MTANCEHHSINLQSSLFPGIRDIGSPGDMVRCADCGETVKRCGACELYKLTAEFKLKEKDSRSGLHSWCSRCLSKARSRYHKKKCETDPTHLKRHRLQRRYGITLEEFADLLTSQDGRCAICRSADPRIKSGWAVDHNHATGEVRGLLCRPCNMVVGVHELYNIPVTFEFLSYLSNPPARTILSPRLLLVRSAN